MNVTRAEQEEESGDEGEIDATGIEEKDIELVCFLLNVADNFLFVEHLCTLPHKFTS